MRVDFSEIDRKLTDFSDDLINCIDQFYSKHKLLSTLQIEQSSQVIRYLYIKHADPNMADASGRSALDYLCAAINIDLNMDQPATEVHSELANLYILLNSDNPQHIVSVSSTINLSNYSALLHVAAVKGDIKEVIHAIESGVNVNVQDRQGATALNKAVCTLLVYYSSWQRHHKEVESIKKKYLLNNKKLLSKLPRNVNDCSTQLISFSTELINNIDSYYSKYILPSALQVEQILQVVRYLYIKHADPNMADASGCSALDRLRAAITVDNMGQPIIIDSDTGQRSEDLSELANIYRTLSSRSAQHTTVTSTASDFELFAYYPG